MPTGTGSIGADGTFAVDGLSPGAYVLRANPRGFSAPGSSSESEWPSIAEVIVAGEDLTGIRLAPLAPIRLAGTISFAGAPQPMPPRQGMRVRLVAVSPLPVLGAAPSAMPQEDGSFMLSAMPGRFLVRPTLDPLGTTGEPSPWALRSVRLNGADVTDTGIELAAGADVQGLEVEMTNLRTEVVGAVTDQRGVRLIEYAVVIFSRDRERWGGGRHLAIARPEEEGRFRVRTLAPADYEAVALDSVGTNLLQDREFVESLRGAGTTFTLGEASQSSSNSAFRPSPLDGRIDTRNMTTTRRMNGSGQSHKRNTCP